MPLTRCLLASLAVAASAKWGATPSDPTAKRSSVAHALSTKFGGAVGAELLDKFDKGKFVPRLFAQEEGIEDQYLISWHKDCALPQWAEQEGHGRKHFAHARVTAIKQDRDASSILMALRDTSGCVKVVEQDVVVRIPEMERVSRESSGLLEAESVPLPWGIDFLDAEFTEEYEPPYNGSGVHVYVIDTGIDPTHPWLEGNTVEGFDALEEDITTDYNGHGTHCAGTVGGMFVGVARGVTLVPVRVLGAEGAGSMLTIIIGMDWVAQQKEANPDIPMVASMSLGGPNIVQASNDAANALNDAGVTVIVAAGNSFVPGAWFTPCAASDVLCVGALANPAYPSTGETFTAASYSNWGEKVEIWAPGSDVTSARSSVAPIDGDGLAWTISGTSMACPHVAGIAAQILSWNPTWTPEQVKAALTTDCSVDFGGYGVIKHSHSKVVRTKNSDSTSGPCGGGFAVDVPGAPFWQQPVNQMNAAGILVIASIAVCCSAFCTPRRKVSLWPQAAQYPPGLLAAAALEGVNLDEYYIPEQKWPVQQMQQPMMQQPMMQHGMMPPQQQTGASPYK